MKQFSDLLDTRFLLSVQIVLVPIAYNGAPWCTISCNNTVLMDNHLLEKKQWTISIDVLDHIDISIGMQDKIYSAEKETAIVIESITIDEFEIVPSWTHLAEYTNERNFIGPTSYLGFNGTWKLSIPEPFYRWKHRVTGQGWLLYPTT